MQWLPPLLTAAVACGILTRAAFLRGPAEWQWEYSRRGLAGGFLVLAVLLAGAIVWLGGGRAFARAGRGLFLAIALGAALSWSVIGAEPGGWRRVLDALASPQVFGYVADSGLAPPTPRLLTDYPEASAALSMHSRTHPPGPILAVRALDAAVRALPLPDAGAIPDPAAAALERERRRARDHGRPEPDHLPSPWTLVVLAWLLPGFGALAAWPLAVLARDLDLPAEAASAGVALWLLVPARTVFTPSLDQALPLGLVAATVCARRGARGAGARRSAGERVGPGELRLPALAAGAPGAGLLRAGGRPGGRIVRAPAPAARGLFLGGLCLPLALLGAGAGFDVVESVRTGARAAP
jgi:hypothetical protein